MSISQEILDLLRRGYSFENIAEYTGYDMKYIRKINELKEKFGDDNTRD